jgi:hypothetical protein
VIRARKLGNGALAWRGGSLQPGQDGLVPESIARAYAHKLLILDAAPQPEPVEPVAVVADAAAGSVAEVLARVDAGTVTARQALAAERAGRARVTLIRELEARPDAHA